MRYSENPFSDPDRKAIWEMLVTRDIEAFLKADWSLVADDFCEEGFVGLHAHGSDTPDSWRLGFPTLQAYRDEWLRQAQATKVSDFAEPLHEALFRVTNLRDIDLGGEVAVAHKKFDGVIERARGGREVMNWQTLYLCARRQGRWRITGFIGYLPFPMGRARKA